MEPYHRCTVGLECPKCKSLLKFDLKNNSYQTNATITINNQPYTIKSDIDHDTNLAEFIRNNASLTGTKQMCREGGCGACTVEVLRPYDLDKNFKSINSCLIPVVMCDNWKVRTIEYYGSKREGLNETQTLMCDNNGTQCGYCTPGMIMTMQGVLSEKPSLTGKERDKMLGGNLCRCTGYRGILDAFQQARDIEDIVVRRNDRNEKHIFIGSETGTCHPDGKLVSGSTGHAYYQKTDNPTKISINSIPEMKTFFFDGQKIRIGAAITLTEMKNKFINSPTQYGPQFKYLLKVAEHINEVGHLSIRNQASWSGNLMMKMNKNNFPSTLNLILFAIGSKIIVRKTDNTLRTIPIIEWTESHLESEEYIFELQLFPLKSNEQLQFHKVMPTAQNALALVGGAFKIEIDPTSMKILSQPILAYSNLGTFEYSKTTTSKMINKSLLENNDVNFILKSLDSELVTIVPSITNYQKKTAVNLLYKTMVEIVGSKANPIYQSASSNVKEMRAVSSGVENFQELPKDFPLTEAVNKMDADIQTTGEAKYIPDMPITEKDLFGVYVQSTIASGQILSINYEDAAKVPGYVTGLDATDIPGINNGIPNSDKDTPEEILASNEILFYGQPVGLVIAESMNAAYRAAYQVKVKYMNVNLNPIITLQQAIDKKNFFPTPVNPIIIGNADEAIKNSPIQLTETLTLGGQYHYYLEKQNSYARPTASGGLEVLSSSQWLTATQNVIAQAANIPCSEVNVSARRLGGAFGGKITRPHSIAAMAAIGALKTNRPVRVELGLQANMQMVGARPDYVVECKVGCEKNGKLNGVKLKYYQNSGCYPTDQELAILFEHFENIYKCDNWDVSGVLCKTNTASRTATRSPGHITATHIIESLMDMVANAVGSSTGFTPDPLSVRSLNYYKKGDITPQKVPLTYYNFPEIFQKLMEQSEYSKRLSDIQNYNSNNLWKKKGLAFMPLRFPTNYGSRFGVLISIHAADGSVRVAHGGIDSGQGIHTKVQQLVAYQLNIPSILIKIHKTNSFISNNSSTTGGSITSELNAKAAEEACQILLDRLKPIRKKMKPNYKWSELIKKADELNVNLTAQSYITVNKPMGQSIVVYNVYCGCVAEVIVDRLTGEHDVVRVDMVYDIGRTLSPKIDMGQAQGGFLMGYGLMACEEMVFDEKTGKLLTGDTWNYHIPGVMDIPQDLRITFLPNKQNPLGVLKTKVIGEPPMHFGTTVYLAINRALSSAQKMVTNLLLNAPATVEKTSIADDSYDLSDLKIL
ncbi:hypothetical protein SNEBB_005211 [Seison nebaliae]|nr:hypothetical protein SNEBB_005211 [Seison nebaliae]